LKKDSGKRTENYDVIIELENEKITKSTCTCPFDLSEFCKHQIAIFNFIKYSDLAKNPHSGKLKKVESIINNFSQKKLKTVLIHILKKNRDLREDFLKKENNSLDSFENI